MLRTLRNSKGLTLPELMVVSALCAGLLVAFGVGYTRGMKVQKNVSERKSTEKELLRAMTDVLRVGRIARNCSRVISTEPTATAFLECTVDMNDPPTATSADDTKMRFGVVLVDGQKQFQSLKETASVFILHSSYDKIDGFEICDDARMANGCQIPQTEINTRHIANLSATLSPTSANRYFRFQLKSGGALSDNGGALRSVQSAFYVRHPTPNGVDYVWGMQDE